MNEGINISSTTEGEIEELIVWAGLSQGEYLRLFNDRKAGYTGFRDSIKAELDSFSRNLPHYSAVHIEISSISDTDSVDLEGSPLNLEEVRKTEDWFNSGKVGPALDSADLKETKYKFRRTPVYAATSTHLWPRDRYTRFEDNSGVASYSYIFNLNDHQDVLDKLIPITKNVVDIASGNLHVLGDFVFIGHDVLKLGLQLNALSDTNKVLRRLTNLGLDRSATSKVVTDHLSAHFGKSVVWVGTSTLSDIPIGYQYDRYLFKKSYQPFYHLDLFFLPWKITGHGNNRTLWYFIADPGIEWQNPKCYGTNEGMNKEWQLTLDVADSSLSKTTKHINKQLRDRHSIKGKPIPIPMPFLERPDKVQVDKVYAFLNGLIHDEVYYMPKFTDRRDTSEHYIESLRVADSIVDSQGFDCIQVPHRYNATAALHCFTFEVSRR